MRNCDFDRMPEFDTEDEFEAFFADETALCDKFRNAEGMLEFKDKTEFFGFLDELLGEGAWIVDGDLMNDE